MTRDLAYATAAASNISLFTTNSSDSKKSSPTTTTTTTLSYDQQQQDIETHREFLLFPTYAKRNPSDSSQWIVRTKGWALSHNSSTAKQKMMMGITKSVAGKSFIDKNSSVMFEERFKYFLATNKRHKHFLIQAIGTVTLEESRKYRKNEVSKKDQEEDIFNMLSTRSMNQLITSPLSYYCHIGKKQIIKSFQQQYENICFPITPPPTDEEEEFDYYDVEDEWNSSSILSRPNNPISSVLDGNYFSCTGRRNSTDKQRSSSLSSSFCSASTTTTSSTNNTTTMITAETEEEDGGVHLRTKGSGFLSGQFLIPHDTILNWAQEQNQCDARLIKLQSICTSDYNKFSPNRNVVNLIEPIGISIISDIDDTIKDTQIKQGARTVLSKTFFESPKDVTGMADAYMSWYSQGASFHYVSNSPFQLMSMLDRFIRDSQFPPGSMHLRDDGKLISRLVETPGQAKRDAILDILRDFPQRHFVLIGDSGEIDLEIYTRIALEYPHQILKIYIRDVTTPTITELKKSTSDTVMKQQARKTSSTSASSTISSLFPKRRSQSASDFTVTPSASTSAPLNKEKKKFRSPLGMRRAVTTVLAEYAVEPHLTGHRTTTQQEDTDNQSEEDGLLDPHIFQHKISTGEACAQLYHRIEKARNQLGGSIDIILFQDADILQNDLEIRNVLWDMLDNNSLLEQEQILSSSPKNY